MTGARPAVDFLFSLERFGMKFGLANIATLCAALIGVPFGALIALTRFHGREALIILLKGLTPIPYKIVTITSGFAGYNVWLFVLCSVIARGGRFFDVGDFRQLVVFDFDQL